MMLLSNVETMRLLLIDFVTEPLRRLRRIMDQTVTAARMN